MNSTGHSTEVLKLPPASPCSPSSTRCPPNPRPATGEGTQGGRIVGPERPRAMAGLGRSVKRSVPIFGPYGSNFDSLKVRKIADVLASFGAAGERNRFFDFSCFRSFNFCISLFIIYSQHDNASEHTIRRLSTYPNIVISCIQGIVLSS